MKDPTVIAVVDAFEREKLAPADIASAMCLEVSLVKDILARESAEYRVQTSAAPGEKDPYEILSDDEFKQLRTAYKNLVTTDLLPPAARAKHMQWLLNEKKGRNNVKAGPAVPSGIPTYQLNVFLEQIRAKSEAQLRNLSQPQTVDA